MFGRMKMVIAVAVISFVKVFGIAALIGLVVFAIVAGEGTGRTNHGGRVHTPNWVD